MLISCCVDGMRCAPAVPRSGDSSPLSASIPSEESLRSLLYPQRSPPYYTKYNDVYSPDSFMSESLG